MNKKFKTTHYEYEKLISQSHIFSKRVLAAYNDRGNKYLYSCCNCPLTFIYTAYYDAGLEFYSLPKYYESGLQFLGENYNPYFITCNELLIKSILE